MAPWVLLQRDTPSGVAAFADDALAASRAAMRAAAGLQPAAEEKKVVEEKTDLQSTPSTPRDRDGRRKPKRRPLTNVEKAQQEEWQSIQREHQEHQGDRRLRAAAKVAWGEEFRKQLTAKGDKAGQKAAARQLDNDAEYIRATRLYEQKRKKAAAVSKARRQHDIAALNAWRQEQSGAASAAAAKEEEERVTSEQQWKAIQANKAAQQTQRKNQKQIVKHRGELERLLRMADDAATSATYGDAPLAQPGGRVESAAWQLSPNDHLERWKSVQRTVRAEARKAQNEQMREKYKERTARSAGEGATQAGSEWARWPACTDRARSSPQTG
jgi:hypothetical protein